MFQQNIKEIIRALIIKSEKNEVNWVPTGDYQQYEEAKDFSVNLPEYSLNVYSSNDGFMFAIFDGYGNALLYYKPENPDDEAELEKLFHLAHNSAAGVDKILEILKESLSTDEIIGTQRNISPNDDIPF